MKERQDKRTINKNVFTPDFFDQYEVTGVIEALQSDDDQLSFDILETFIAHLAKKLEIDLDQGSMNDFFLFSRVFDNKTEFYQAIEEAKLDCEFINPAVERGEGRIALFEDRETDKRFVYIYAGNQDDAISTAEYHLQQLWRVAETFLGIEDDSLNYNELGKDCIKSMAVFLPLCLLLDHFDWLGVEKLPYVYMIFLLSVFIIAFISYEKVEFYQATQLEKRAWKAAQGTLKG
ncbi:MAG: hypothetical protein PVJ09_01030 [Candidatus Woesebacteria bacterium]|jgi:hypothetical protein